MHALTIHQPWVFCIAQDTKRIENRGWPPPKWIIGKRLAIHAGKKVYDRLKQLGPEIRRIMRSRR